MKPSYLIHLILPLMLAACAEKESEESEADDTKTEGGQTGGGSQTGGVGTLAVDTNPSTIMSTFHTAISSTATAGGSTEGLLPGALAVQSSLMLDGDSANCTSSGTPVNQDDEDGLQAGMRAYCSLVQPADGPDTVLGGIVQVQGFLCMLDGKLTYDGQQQDMEVTFDTDCWSEEFLQNVAGNETVTAEVTAYQSVPEYGNASAFAQAIEISIPTFEVGYKITFKSQNSTLVAAVLKEDGNSTFAVNLDRSEAGLIRYEGRFVNPTGDGGPVVRHIRSYAQGTFDATDGVFTEVEKLDFLYWDVDKHDTGDSGWGVSVRGGQKTGYRAVYFKGEAGVPYDASQYTVATDGSVCYGGGDCTGNDGIVPASAADSGFVSTLNPDGDSYLNAADWFKTNSLLEFESVSTAGAVP